MSLESKFMDHSALRTGRYLRLWIGGALLAWLIMLAAIVDMMLQTGNQGAQDQGDALNQIVPAAGSDKKSDAESKD